MGLTAENNQYYKGKQTVIDEFSGSHKTLLSAIAGRKFLKPPGYLLEASLALELASKHKLSALNYAIVAEAVQRELVQTGHDYSNTYKTARIAFEIEKQTLLADLQRENAGIDVAHSLDEEEVDRLFVELDVRKLILITSKTNIDLEMEALKKELLGVERLTFDNETSLINEKLSTATAKLAVIPYIEALILAQEKILSEESAIFPFAESLIDSRKSLIAKKEELVPYIGNKADAQVGLADKKTELIPQIAAKAELRIDLATKKAEILSYVESKIDAQVALSGVKETLLVYIEKLVDKRTQLTDTKISLLPYMEEKSTRRQQLAFEKEGLLPDVAAKAESIIELANKELELIPYIADKSNEYIQLADATIKAVAIDAERLQVATDKAKLRIDKVDGALEILSAEDAIEKVRQTLTAARQTLQIAGVGRQAGLASERALSSEEITTAHTGLTSGLTENKLFISGADLEARGMISDADLSGDIATTDIAVEAEKTSIRRIAAYNVASTIETADAAATARITSELIHLLGGA